MGTFKRDVPVPHNEFRFGSWKELKEYLDSTFINQFSWDWVFRGHSREDYPLDSTLDRLPVPHSRLTAEQYLLYQFQKAAHHYIESSGLPQTTLEWLSLMQHYGAPTRLLDFTRSPYVACFFALEDFHAGDWRAVWCINAAWLRKQTLDRIKKAVAGYDQLEDYELQDSSFLADHFHELFFEHSIPMVVAMEPPRSHERLLVQQGLFLCPGAVDKGFQDNLLDYRQTTPDMDNYVCKLMIHTDHRKDALYDLHFMNVNRASLFQGLDGFARSLAHKLELEYEKDQIERLLKQPNLPK